MHAGGMIMGEMLTNSIEAFKFWCEKGEHFFEFDICRTEDGEYVTCHDLDIKKLHELGINSSPRVLTAEWFVSQELYFNNKGPFHAMNLKDVLHGLSCGNIECVMLDLKDFTFNGTLHFLGYLETQLSEYEIKGANIVVELYNSAMIDASKKYPSMVTYQYCVDDDIQQGNSYETRKLPNEELVNYLKGCNINVVSYPWKQAVENLPLLKMLVDKGFVVFSRTRNNIFHELLEQAKVSINIVDEILSDETMLKLQPYKKQYMANYQKQIDLFFK